MGMNSDQHPPYEHQDEPDFSTISVMPLDQILEARRPDPTVLGPCETRLSFLCSGEGYLREYPLNMLATHSAFTGAKVQCLPCYEMAADLYVKALHR